MLKYDADKLNSTETKTAKYILLPWESYTISGSFTKSGPKVQKCSRSRQSAKNIW